MWVITVAKIQVSLASILACPHTATLSLPGQTSMRPHCQPNQQQRTWLLFAPFSEITLLASFVCYTFLYLTSPSECHLRTNLSIFISKPTLADIWCILSLLLHLSTKFSCQTCILLVKENTSEWSTSPLQNYRYLQWALGHWIFMHIWLYKHFHMWVEPTGFVGRSILKQKGRKNTMLCSVRGMEKPYWTALTKTDVCQSTEGYIQTRIKTASA